MHSRVFKATAIALIFALCCMPAIYINNAMGYLLAATVLFLMLLFRAYLLLCSRFCTIAMGQGAACAIRGEEVAISVLVQNKLPLFVTRMDVIFVEIDEAGNEEELACESFSLLPRETRSFDYALQCDHVGTFTIAAKQAILFDPFCLFSKMLEVGFSQTLDVEPYLFDVSSMNVEWNNDLESDESLTTTLNEGMDYYGVREYAEGDALKSIHWILSARFERQYTRLYEQSKNPGLSILCDFSGDYAGKTQNAEERAFHFDALVESAFSIEQYALNCGMNVDIQFMSGYERCCYDGYSDDDYLDILHRMPVLGQPSSNEFLHMIDMQQTSFSKKSNLVVVSANPTQELMRGVLALKQSRKYPILVIVCSRFIAPQDRPSAFRELLSYVVDVPVFIIADTKEFEKGVARAI